MAVRLGYPAALVAAQRGAEVTVVDREGVRLAHTFSGHPSLSGSTIEVGRQLTRHDDLDEQPTPPIRRPLIGWIGPG